MLRRYGILLLGLAVLMALAVPSVAGPNGTDRPFKASFEGEVHWAFPGRCAVVTTITEAAGQATHLGRVELDSSHCPAEENYVMDGMTTFTAANGDQLYAVYDYPGDDDGIQVYFDGGTGRFANATGSAVWSYGIEAVLIEGCDDEDDFACLDFSAVWPWWSTLEGSISY